MQDTSLTPKINKRITRIKPRSELEYEEYLKGRGFSDVLKAARVLLREMGETLSKWQKKGLYRDYKRWLSRFNVAKEMNCATLPSLKVERCYRCGWVLIYDHIHTSKLHNDCGNKLCYRGRFAGNEENFKEIIGARLGVDLRLCGTKTLRYFLSPSMREAMQIYPDSKFDESKFYWKVIKVEGSLYFIRIAGRLYDTNTNAADWRFFPGVFQRGQRFIYPMNAHIVYSALL